MNRQARFADEENWTNYGNVGFINAAELHMKLTHDQVRTVEVRDIQEPDAIYSCRMRRVTRFICENPRGDTDKCCP